MAESCGLGGNEFRGEILLDRWLCFGAGKAVVLLLPHGTKPVICPFCKEADKMEMKP